MRKELITKALASFLFIIFTGEFIFNGWASAQTTKKLFPLQEHYQELVNENKHLFDRLKETNLVNEEQIYLFVVDLEAEISNYVINQANADKILKDAVIKEIFSHQEVFNAVKKAYSQEIMDYLLTGKLPADLAGLLSKVKTILLSSVVVALPARGEYSSCTGVTLNSFVEGVSFYYTLDLSQPTVASKKYADEISLPGRPGPVALKAIAWKDGVASDVANFNYEITGDPCQGGLRGFVYLEKANPLNFEGNHTGILIQATSDHQETDSVSAAPDGSYLITGLCPGKYKIHFQYPCGSWKKVVMPITLENCKIVEVQPVTLWLGDMNGDQQINILDLLWMAKMIGLSPGDYGWEEGKKADVNEDCSINILDLLWVAKNIGR